MTLTLRRTPVVFAADEPLKPTMPRVVDTDNFRTLEEPSTLGDHSSETSSTTCSTSHEEIHDSDDSSFSCTSPLNTPLQQKAIRRTRSILKQSQEDIPVCSRRGSWKSLAPPDMDKIQSSRSTLLVREAPVKRRPSSVAFAQVQIREYSQTIGDNPSVSYGPPISLDWQFEEKDPLDLEVYESHRPPRRSMRQLCMNYYQRRNVLMWACGYKEEQVKQATKQADKCKRERAVTKYFLPYSKVEDFVTSAGRKAKRAVKSNK